MRHLTLLALAALGALSGCGGSSGDASAVGNGSRLSGVLTITAPTCATKTVTGSWFRMVQPKGTVAAGPFVDNPDSPCADRTLTPLRPGAERGLRLSGFQPQPAQPFGAGGDALATAVTGPSPFFAVAFGVSTNTKDPQTGKPVPAPSVRLDGSALIADLRAWSVAWNGQQFNQGAPKPDGSGAPPHGSYDPATNKYSLEWTSRIVGGPFNNFTGIWHLEGEVSS